MTNSVLLHYSSFAVAKESVKDKPAPSKSKPGSFDAARMENSLSSASNVIPDGLTIDELRAYFANAHREQ